MAKDDMAPDVRREMIMDRVWELARALAPETTHGDLPREVEKQVSDIARQVSIALGLDPDTES